MLGAIRGLVEAGGSKCFFDVQQILYTEGG
jgi:hypothetical protein